MIDLTALDRIRKQKSIPQHTVDTYGIHTIDCVDITYTSPFLSGLKFLLNFLDGGRLLRGVGAARCRHANRLREDHLVRQTALRHLLAADLGSWHTK